MGWVVILLIAAAAFFVIVLIVAAGFTAVDVVREQAREHEEAKAALERYKRRQHLRR